MDALTLVLADDDDFAWLLGEAPAPRAMTAAADLAPTEVLRIVRPLPASWMIVVGGEIVGLVSLMDEPNAAREAEIGYGVAPSRWGEGWATRAVTALLPILTERGLAAVLASTSVDNPDSQRVLERNGFAQAGTRIDDEDGPLILWRRALVG
ncbi:MAG: GNAT family protein [Sphingomicrobium sp.]